LVLAVLLFFVFDLFCYIDPASTAIIWQVLAGVFIALSVALGIWWRKISVFIKKVWVKLFGKGKKVEADKVEKDEELQ
jgi:hypothetical protein